MPDSTILQVSPGATGQRISPPSTLTDAGSPGRQHGGVWSLPEVRWAAASVALFVVGLALRAVGMPTAVSTTVLLAGYATGGWEPLVAGLQALRERTLDVDLLMVVAAVGAAAIGQTVDGGLLIVIFATSGAQEAFATKRTRDSVRALLTLAPEQAVRVGPDGDERTAATADLEVGNRVLVRPGERIGADGTVLDGASEVDQSSVTGEPLPVLREPGDEVFAGTMNTEGTLLLRVDAAAGDSVVARIVTLVERASATKARTQLFIETVEQRYSAGVVVATLAVLLVPLGLGEALRPALLRAMTFMIVASPCAVVLATMPPLLSAIANAGRHGVLVTSAVVMERLGGTTRVAFDKTGTLTQGTPRVGDVTPVDGWDVADLLALAAAAERPSEHPLGRAVVAAAEERGMRPDHAADFSSAPGRGVAATVGSRRVQVGSPALLGPAGAAGAGARATGSGAAAAEVARLESAGLTAVVVVVDGVAAGVLGLTDRPRPSARAAVAAVTAEVDQAPVLLTGDNPRAAGLLAAEVGITDVRASLLPEAKVAEVVALRAGDHRVMVVGDGVNDAPALAAADVGVAMGGRGSDLTLQTADVVLVHDELDALATIVRLSRRARRAVVQNLVLAGAAIVGLVVWDLVGHLPLPLGVAGHEGGTVLVGLNGLRLLREAAWAGSPRPTGGATRTGA